MKPPERRRTRELDSAQIRRMVEAERRGECVGCVRVQGELAAKQAELEAVRKAKHEEHVRNEQLERRVEELEEWKKITDAFHAEVKQKINALEGIVAP